MAPGNYTDSMQSVSAAYRSRAENVAASEERDADDAVEVDTLEHDTHDLTDEQKFVGGVDVKKDAESEEDFLPTPDAEDGDDDSPEDEDEAAVPTKSWRKDQIVDYLLSVDIGVERDDLEAMTKDQLLDRFVDNS